MLSVIIFHNLDEKTESQEQWPKKWLSLQPNQHSNKYKNKLSFPL